MSASTMPEWRKRSNSTSNYTDSPVLAKRQKIDYFYVLASESSLSEDERSESVDSIQGRETDYCRDTSDTDTKSEQNSEDEYDVKVEYELVTSSGTEENPFASGSSSGDDALIAAGAVAATLANDGSDIDIWVTDGDDETDSVSSIVESIQQICKKCRIRETVSCFPLCSHCYQIRKNCYPPRPRHKKSKNLPISTNNHSMDGGSLTTDRLSACLNVLSQDSGLGSSQEIQTSTNNSSQELQTFAWDEVVVPKNLIKSTDSVATTSSTSIDTATSTSQKVCAEQTIEDWAVAAKELCIMCNENPKNGIFVHSSGGHLCCCYNCAVKSWTKTKRCAWCNLKVKNVIKAFLV